MKQTNDIFIKLIQDINQPAGIIDEFYDVLHVNKSFEDIFQIKINKEKRKTISGALRTLNLKLIENNVESPQQIRIPQNQQVLIVVVYLLNKNKKKENLFLLLISDKEKNKKKTNHSESS